MDKIKAKEAEKELTLALLYLSRFAQEEKFSEAEDFYAWKGYEFVASRPSMVFCSPQCKNQYNVYKNRAKNKERQE